MSVVAKAQRAFERLAVDKRTEPLSRLCLAQTVRIREALSHDEADVESARAFNEVLHAALAAMPSLLAGSSNPHHGEGSSDVEQRVDDPGADRPSAETARRRSPDRAPLAVQALQRTRKTGPPVAGAARRVR